MRNSNQSSVVALREMLRDNGAFFDPRFRLEWIQAAADKSGISVAKVRLAAGADVLRQLHDEYFRVWGTMGTRHRTPVQLQLASLRNRFITDWAARMYEDSILNQKAYPAFSSSGASYLAAQIVKIFRWSPHGLHIPAIRQTAIARALGCENTIDGGEVQPAKVLLRTLQEMDFPGLAQSNLTEQSLSDLIRKGDILGWPDHGKFHHPVTSLGAVQAYLRALQSGTIASRPTPELEVAFAAPLPSADLKVDTLFGELNPITGALNALVASLEMMGMSLSPTETDVTVLKLNHPEADVDLFTDSEGVGIRLVHLTASGASIGVVIRPAMAA